MLLFIPLAISSGFTDNDNFVVFQFLYQLHFKVHLMKEEKNTLLLENEQLRTLRGPANNEDQEDGCVNFVKYERNQNI